MRYISLFLFVAVIGISSVAEGDDGNGGGERSADEMDPGLEMLRDEFRSSIRASFEQVAQDIEESFGQALEAHINAAVYAAVENFRIEAEQRRVEFGIENWQELGCESAESCLEQFKMAEQQIPNFPGYYISGGYMGKYQVWVSISGSNN